MKDYSTHMIRSNWELLEESDQQKGLPQPPQQKAAAAGAPRAELPAPQFSGISSMTFVDALLGRRSRRKYLDDPLTLEELSFLLFASQGVQEQRRSASLRPAASAGARHPFELYVVAFRIDGLEPGIYRYLAFDHALVREPADQPAGADELRSACDDAMHGQGWKSAATLFWTAIPYRTEWRYTVASPKLIALDAGHSCQNLYLACEAVGCGTCAIGAYDQDKCDALLGVDGRSELTVYAATVGRV